MKQGIIFGLIVLLFSLVGLSEYLEKFDADYARREYQIIENGDLVASGAIDTDRVIWYFEVNGEDIILQDQEISEYFSISDFSNPKEVNLDDISKKIGADAEINMIMIEDSVITMYEANCQDKKCVKQGSINDVGESIICAPHKLIVSIAGFDDAGLDA